MMKHVLAIIALVFILSGCARLEALNPFRQTQPERASVDPLPDDILRPRARPEPGTDEARTAEEFDTSSLSERATAATAGANAGETDLGTTIASLGAVTRPGFWIETPLVKEPGKGRVLYAETGKSSRVELIPVDAPRGAGSRLSLAAMRLVGADLTGLPKIRVFRKSD